MLQGPDALMYSGGNVYIAVTHMTITASLFHGNHLTVSNSNI